MPLPAPPGSRWSCWSSSVSVSAVASSRCCAPSWRSRSIRRRASSAALTRRAREAASSSRVSAFSIASETSCAKAAIRSSVPAGSGSGLAEHATSAPQMRPPTITGPATPERRPRPLISAATAPPTSSKSSTREGRPVSWTWPTSPRPSSSPVLPTGTCAAPSDQPATITASFGFSIRIRFVVCAPSSRPGLLGDRREHLRRRRLSRHQRATRCSAACSLTICSGVSVVAVASTPRLYYALSRSRSRASGSTSSRSS